MAGGKIKPLDWCLSNGEIVEIKTAKEPQISPSWLEKVKTSLARNKISSFLKNQDKEKKIKAARNEFMEKFSFLGGDKKMFEEKLPLLLKRFCFKTEDDLFLNLYEGKIRIERILNFLFPPPSIPKEKRKKGIPKIGIYVAGLKGLRIKLSKCCAPKPMQKILGYISRENVVSIHSKNCPLVSFLDRKRLVPAWWEGEREIVFNIIAHDRPGLLKDITSVFGEKNINIISLKSPAPKNGTVKIRVAFEGPFMLNYLKIIEKLKAIKDIKKVVSLQKNNN